MADPVTSLAGRAAELRARAEAELAAQADATAADRARAEEAAAEAELRRADRFLRAGGAFTFVEWSAFSPERQAALRVAGDQLARERAAFVADLVAERLRRPA